MEWIKSLTVACLASFVASTEERGGAAGGFRRVTRPLVLQKTFRSIPGLRLSTSKLLNISANEVKKAETLASTCVSPVGCRPPPLPDQPLALRQLLWLDDDLFVGVVSGPLPTSSTLLMLRPDGDAGDALTAR